jgi:hypothetical protein
MHTDTHTQTHIHEPVKETKKEQQKGLTLRVWCYGRQGGKVHRKVLVHSYVAESEARHTIQQWI